MKKIILCLLIGILAFATIDASATTERISIDQCKVTFSKDYTYTGNGFTPTPKVTYKKKKLVKNVDYYIYYKDNVEVGTATVTLTGIGNYKGSTTATFTIKKGKQTIKANDINATYGDAPTYLSVMSDNPVTYKSSDTSVCTVNDVGTVTFVNAGKAKIIVSAAGNSNVLPAKISVNVNVSKIPTVINAYGGYVYKGRKQSLGAVSSSGAKLTFSSSNKKIATVSKKGVVTAKKIGKVKITVKSPATKNYKAASKSFDIEVIKP